MMPMKSTLAFALVAALALAIVAVPSTTAFAFDAETQESGRPAGCDGNPHSGPTRDGGNPHHPPVDEGDPHFCPGDN